MDVVCCSLCFHKLHQVDDEFSAIWVAMCAHACIHDVMFLNEDKIDFPEGFIEKMEGMGFISSTDAPGIIKIKVNGMQKKDDYISFCVNRMEHASPKNKDA